MFKLIHATKLTNLRAVKTNLQCSNNFHHWTIQSLPGSATKSKLTSNLAVWRKCTRCP